MRTKPVVGQTVYRKSKVDGLAYHLMTVVAVGRKYFEVKGNDSPDWLPETRVLISGWMTAKGSNNYQVYPSHQAILNEAEEADLCRKIGDAFKGDYSCGNRKDLPLDAIRRIAAIIDSEAGKK
jgi:hypothetical protein